MMSIWVMIGLAGFAAQPVEKGQSAEPTQALVNEMVAKLDRPGKEKAGEPVSNLPFAPGLKFRALDDYLAFLRKGGAIDKPWYREVSPGVYELVTTFRPLGQDRTPQRFTREELERKFGFDR